MQEYILKCLKESDADAWEIDDRCTEGWEFYFIRHKLDQNRAKLVEHTTVTVYKKSEDGKFLGNASIEIPQSSTEAEIKEIIERLIRETAYVKNPVYELNKPEDHKLPESGKVNVSMIAGDFIDTMKNLPETDTEDINSYEIFVDNINVHFMNSNGIDISYSKPSSFLEVVVNARQDDREVELYRSYESGTCNRKYVSADIAKALSYGRDRLNTTPTPAIGKTAVIFSTKDAVSIYEYFASRTFAAMKYSGISTAEIGKPVIENVKGDKVTLRTVPILPDSSCNSYFDNEGAFITETTLIDNNIVKNFRGSRKFSEYLGIKDSFIPRNFTVDGGTRTDEEIKSGNYIEIVEFSDFQVDPIGGDIAGEIRLGYWHHDNKVDIVSGGSVSGKLSELAGDMFLSKNQTQYDNYLIPSLTRIEGVTVSGT